MQLRLPARIYFWAVTVCAAGLAIPAIVASGAPPPDILLVLSLVLAAVIAGAFPLQLSPRLKVTVDTAVYFAAVLLFPTVWAVFVAAAGGLASGLAVAAVKGRGAGGRTLRSTIFNASQLSLSVGLASVAFTVLAGSSGKSALSSTNSIWAVPAAAAVMYMGNTVLVSMMVALQRAQSIPHIWFSAQRVAALQLGALFVIGLGTALLSVHYAWGFLVMALPVAVVFVSLKRTVELITQTVDAVEAMADVVDAADPYTYEHSKRVAEYSVTIARELGLSPGHVETLRQAARVHDLGKVGVPGEILRKPGRLTDDERRAMQAHVLLGYQILSRFPEYQEGRDLVLRHHERYDGEGYPHRVEASKLAIQAQIMPVADALDAMTTDRPYRRATSLRDALIELERGAGTQWHPEVVAAAVRALEPSRAEVRGLAPTPA